MSTHALRSHAAAAAPGMFANWLALIALLALGIVWPPPNTAGALARLHPLVTAAAPAELPRVTCAQRSAR
jgi:hypothetical protein